MFELFSDIFACRDNALTRVDPRVKLFAALALILAVVFSTKVFLPLAVAAISLMAMLALSIRIKLVLFRLAGPLGIVLVIVILQSFLTPGEPIFQIGFFGYQRGRHGSGHLERTAHGIESNWRCEHCAVAELCHAGV